MFSMLKFNLVLALFFLNVGVFAEDEKFIGCAIKRMKVPKYNFDKTFDPDSTERLIKYDPLISIKDGDFEMLIGKEKGEELFPDGIEYHFIGKPTLLEYSNSYRWYYSTYDGEGVSEPLYSEWSVTINRESLDMSESKRKTTTYTIAMYKDYSCRLIDKVSFEKYKKELSEYKMKANADARKKEKEEQAERERKSKI